MSSHPLIRRGWETCVITPQSVCVGCKRAKRGFIHIASEQRRLPTNSYGAADMHGQKCYCIVTKLVLYIKEKANDKRWPLSQAKVRFSESFCEEGALLLAF